MRPITRTVLILAAGVICSAQGLPADTGGLRRDTGGLRSDRAPVPAPAAPATSDPVAPETPATLTAPTTPGTFPPAAAVPAPTPITPRFAPRNASAPTPAPAAAPAPAATLLPDIGVSVTDVSSVSDKLPEAPDGGEFSYGTATTSLLFTPKQIDAMKRALSAYERVRDQQPAGPIAFTEVQTEITPPTEPVTYPTFFLSSIAFRDPSDWTVWLDTVRITPKHNDGEVRVTSVGPNSASFVWAPTYASVVAERHNKGLFATTDPVKHRLTRPGTAVINKDGTVSFTLKPNQSFVSGYMSTFEGKVPSPALPPFPKADGTGLNADQAAQIGDLLDPNAPAPSTGGLKPPTQPAMPGAMNPAIR